MKFRNPILPGFYPDPSICRVGEVFYMVTSTFEYFPGVPIFKSKNLVNWEQIGHCLERNSQIDLREVKSSGGIFAPTLRYNDGTFYMITTEVNNLGHFYVTAKNPEGPWSDPIQVEGDNFDPDLFFDDDGKVYFSYMGMEEGIKQYEIDIETGKRISEECVIWKGFEDKYSEAPHVYKIGSWYYLLVAEGGTHRTHMIVCARSESPKGPFVSCPTNPVLTHRCAIFNQIYHTGHGDFVQYTDGSWWVVFLGVRTIKSNFHLGRETFLAPVKWTDDQWPVINNGEYVQLEMESETLLVNKQSDDGVFDSFDKVMLAFEWNFRRNPDPKTWSLSERPGYLRLCGNKNNLNSDKQIAFVGRRQQDFCCRATVKLEFNPQNDGEEAGLTVISNEEHHYEIAVIRKNNKNKIILRKRIGDLQSIVTEVLFLGTCVYLTVEANQEYYTFKFCEVNKKIGWHVPEPSDKITPLQIKDSMNQKILGSGMTRYLSAQIHDGFTGVYFGMYATGNGHNSKTPADFDWFEYKCN